MIEMIRQGLLEDGVAISISKICRYLGIPRRTV
jgi:putative transposase